jgi:hypothetical protein
MEDAWAARGGGGVDEALRIVLARGAEGVPHDAQNFFEPMSAAPHFEHAWGMAGLSSHAPGALGRAIFGLRGIKEASSGGGLRRRRAAGAANVERSGGAAGL